MRGYNIQFSEIFSVLRWNKKTSYCRKQINKGTNSKIDYEQSDKEHIIETAIPTMNDYKTNTTIIKATQLKTLFKNSANQSKKRQQIIFV